MGLWILALEFHASHGIAVSGVITDNGSNYRSHDWRHANIDLGILVHRTRPYRPQTNGKAERYQGNLRDEWGYAKAYRSESSRRAALTIWLHIYNHHRPHIARSGKPPATRVTNLLGQNS